MSREEYNLLAKWLDGTLPKSEFNELDNRFDLHILNRELACLDRLDLNVTPLEDSWKIIQQKIKANSYPNEVDLSTISVLQ